VRPPDFTLELLAHRFDLPMLQLTGPDLGSDAQSGPRRHLVPDRFDSERGGSSASFACVGAESGWNQLVGAATDSRIRRVDR